MAEMRSASTHQDLKNWSQESRKMAEELRSSAHRAAEELFASCELDEYLTLLSRLHFYDTYNLLLILQQYPKATCLAGFKIWQKQLSDPTSQVLKPEWRGKGIDLIAPYTDAIGGGNYFLTWYAVKQFDISQTNVTSYQAPPSIYEQDASHIPLLLRSVIDTLSLEYHQRVLYTSGSPELKAAGLAGEVATANSLTLLADAKPAHQLHWLTDQLCQHAVDAHDTLFTTPQRHLAAQLVFHCLFHIWGMTDKIRSKANPAVLQSIHSEARIAYLSLIHRTLRSLDDSVSYHYCERRTDFHSSEPYES